MSEMIAAAASPAALLVLLSVWGLLPGVLGRVLASAYPKTHPRRQELIAELSVVPRWEKPFWVLEQFGLLFGEAAGLRMAERKRRRAVDAAQSRRGRHQAPGRFNPLTELKTMAVESGRSVTAQIRALAEQFARWEDPSKDAGAPHQ